MHFGPHTLQELRQLPRVSATDPQKPVVKVLEQLRQLKPPQLNVDDTGYRGVKLQLGHGHSDEIHASLLV